MKILIVEDDEINVEIIQIALKGQGFSNDVARCGKDCIYMVTSSVYDVILLDLMLPDMSGHELLSKIRKKGIKTPVIITSASADIENKVKGFSNLADDYLVKPFEAKELICRICIQVRHNGKKINK